MGGEGKGRESVFRATRRTVPPSWAIWQRQLMATMSEAAIAFVDRYTRPDGTLIWRDEWPGMDGADDGYESFQSFPVLFALGGSDALLPLARKEWNALTWQFTHYGQIHREFFAYYDWMHHGEGNLLLYHLALADPTSYQERWRAIRFAAFYIGEDPEAPNWDADRKLIRSPINGSKGPRFRVTADDWCTHRPVLSHYLAPFEDLPNLPDDPMAKVDWMDEAMFAEILKRMNERMMAGDVPLNLTATSLVTHAYLYTGDEKYRRWVLDYVEAWMERARRNGGLLPDNVGLSGRIGENMDGKWWGGYYGWRWPHGAMTIVEPALIAAANALLLTGDSGYLELPRAQLDWLWSLGKEQEGVFVIPHRHGDKGWFDYRPPDPRWWIHLWHLSQDPRDRQRLEAFPDRREWAQKYRRFGKGGQYHPAGWFSFIAGENPTFPETALSDHFAEMSRRLEMMSCDDFSCCHEWDVHHWQDRHPVLCDGLVQQMLGCPQVIYHGGLLHCRVRFFDPQRRRAGLPEGVAALVEQMLPDGIVLHLVNTDPLCERTVLVQAGAFGEHRFTTAQEADAPNTVPVIVNSRYLTVHLLPATALRLTIGMERFAYSPSYALPW